jgi:hypothetical protein
VSATYQQAVLTIQDPHVFGVVREAIASAFSPAGAADFLKSIDRASLRVRNFEGVVEKGLLGASTSAEYKRLAPGDQGQIREFYLASLEHVSLDLRDRFFQLYAYY